MQKQFIMALDQGTTSSRCIIYDRKGEQIGKGQKEFTQIFPQAGWVEHDPEEIWESQRQVILLALEESGLRAEDIAAIGITNQRETTIVWDRDTGRPVYNAIVWQCRRTAEFCDKLMEEGLEAAWREKTGLPIDPYFSATKLAWILDNVDGAREKAEAGELLFGTVDTWLLWKLTGGKVHATDYSNASRTMMYNIHRLCWDEEILKRLDIPEAMLPEVKDSSGVFGHTEAGLFEGADGGVQIPVSGIAGDQQAALFGQTCFDEGMAKNTFGTGGFLLVNTGENVTVSQHGLLNTIAWGLDGKITYALEGSVFVSGATMQWLRDGVRLIDDVSRSGAICRSMDSTDGVYLVPAFTGLGAPYWDPYARGVITGLTRGTSREQIIRAGVESMAYQTVDLVEAMSRDMGQPIRSLRVDGGAARNDFLLEYTADMLGQEVIRPACVETTSLGVAFLAGLAVGCWRDLNDVNDNWQVDRGFVPSMDPQEREKRMKGWRRAVECSLGWAAE